ncbi:MAG: cobalamin-dependent protein [Rhodospirillales bacterium]|nr:cobalamin-dependent protein [Rhodospirillales bacterium]
MPLLIYLADLYHDYLPTRQHVPLGIGYIAEYLQQQLPGKLEIKLFKSADKLLDSIDERQPDVVGLSNYTWNYALNQFAGKQIKARSDRNIPVIMGGPNIRLDDESILAFLKDHDFVDRYVMYSGERPMEEFISSILDLPADRRAGDDIRRMGLKRSYAVVDGELKGGAIIDNEKTLDYIPSPYLSGALDEFLDDNFLPILETNRGCPFSCTFCVWGISALSKLKLFSMERVKAELNYVANYGKTFSELVYADANFGILKRDVEISKCMRELYNTHKTFQAVQIYWSKSAQPHMIDIGKELGHLTHTYVAFQSFDPNVLEAIKRKNIGTEKLVQLINGLRAHTHSTQTDLLVGLPMETVDSHIRSLETALSYGINMILGGEIRLLPGSELDSEADRQQFQLKTKYRLCEGQYGYYRGELVCEFEEVIRQTSTMTEADMIMLRVLRTLFFASVTIGEHRPLISFMVKNNYSIIDIFKELAKPDRAYPAFDQALQWCQEQAEQEWFSSIEDAHEHFADPANADDLFNGKPFLKLNYGMFGRLVGNADEYKQFNSKMESAVLKVVSKEHQEVIADIIRLCKARNIIHRTLVEGKSGSEEIQLSEATWKALEQAEYATGKQDDSNRSIRVLEANPIVESLVSDKLDDIGCDPTILQLSQLLELFRGRTYLALS